MFRLNRTSMKKAMMLGVGILLFGIGQVTAQVLTTKFTGKIISKGEPVIGAKVNVMVDEATRFGAMTNELGEYSAIVEPGTYNISVFYDSQVRLRMDNVDIDLGETKQLNLNITESMQKDVIIESQANWFKVDEVIGGMSFNLNEIRKLPVRKLMDIALLTPGISAIDGDPRNGISIKGGRPGGTVYYIDGVKVVGIPSLPNSSIQQMFVITGGIPAEYGDLTGGVIAITTRNPGMNPVLAGPKVKRIKRKKGKPNQSKVRDFQYENTFAMIYW